MFGHILSDVTFEFLGEDLVDLRNKGSHLWDEFDQTLWNKDDTIVFTHLSSLADDVSNVVSDLRQSLVLLVYLFTDENAVNAGSEGTLKGNMGGGSSHQSDEMVIVLTRHDIRAEVSDSL